MALTDLVADARLADRTFDELLAGMTKRVRGMKTDKINQQDLARSGGPPDAED